MSRSLLHKDKLQAFKDWVTRHPNLDWADTSTVGDRYCLMQVWSKSGGWDKAKLGIYWRHHMPEHLTVDSRLEPTVRQFLRDHKATTIKDQKHEKPKSV